MEDKNFKKKAKDKVTGFVGIITGRCDYVYGCSQYLLIPKVDKTGKMRDGQWFDESRIEIMSDGLSSTKLKGQKGGCEFREHPIS